MERTFRVVDYLVDFLDRQGVEHFFGVGGANIEDLYDAVESSPARLRGVVTKHEFSAACMADGYHRASQKIAAVVSTSGAGAMNLVPGIAELKASCVPSVVLVGQPPAALDGLGSFQETSGRAGTIDAVRLFAELSVYCSRLDDPRDVTTVLPAAYAAATDPHRPGPAVLLLPKDVQQATIPPWTAPARISAAAVPLTASAVRARAVGVLRDAGERLGVAVVAGEGVARADARAELARLAGALDAPVAVVPDAKDVYDGDAPGGLGPIGAFARPGVRERLEQSSAVLLVGTRLPQMAEGGLRDHLKGVPVVCVDGREPYLGDHADLVRLTGPLRTELELLTAALTEDGAVAPPRRPAGTAPGPVPGNGRHENGAHGNGANGNGLSGAATAAASGGPSGDPSAPMDLLTAARTLHDALPPGANVVTDAGNAGATCVRHVGVPRGGRFITAMGMGGMGHSFGAGIGAAFATGRRTYVLAGDGSFFMHGLEVHTAVEHDLPVTFVLFNNNAHAMCHTREQLFYSGDYTYNVFRPARPGAGAAAMFPGLDAVSVQGATELREALLRTHTTSSPSLICIDVDHAEIPPFGPFQAHLEAAGRGRSTEEGVQR